KNIITVFHPHTYTRTKALFKDFISSFDAINELIVLDIYASAREKQGGVSSFQLVMAIKKYNKRQQITQNVQYIPKIVGVAKYLKKHLKKDDLLVLMGAGDVFRVGELLLKKQK
ncbi:MAG: UDP-N-acetylmuramate--L-alanine ligase, partial [Patescibacteria group bacterium]